jgi:hypothetical protein
MTKTNSKSAKKTAAKVEVLKGKKTPNGKRHDAALKAWETIRANRAAAEKAAKSAKKSAKVAQAAVKTVKAVVKAAKKAA